VATLAAGVPDRPLDALLEASRRSSRVSTQILVAVSLVEPSGWQEELEQAILEQGDQWGAAALSSLRPDGSTELADLAAGYEEGGRKVALRWRDSVRTAFEQAGLPHSS
jgi:hypothetical protein